MPFGDLARRLPDAFRTVARDPTVAVLGSPLPERLADRVAVHAARCREVLEET
ncbi:hypothetical protein [Actinoplanes rectilineatus]|uniref:hypothetical protein n=1 Tax=Actinoplanes rectilineatus TaxID=113571 RepID=UPI001FE08BEA|nr:hypothetical protein [Actinoplanes rectilineatus]